MAINTPINKFRKARKRKGLSQQEVARLSGISQPTISGLETGLIKNPSWTVVYVLAQLFGVEPQELAPVRIPRRRQVA